MPRWMGWSVLVLAVLALVPPVLIARARSVTSPRPRLHLIPDMDNQPKYKAQAWDPLFADRRAMRLPVAGAVARGELEAAPAYYHGEINGAWATTFPVSVDETLLRRGQERFNIYCAPCHGLAGYGNGMVSKRAEALEEGTWVPPLSFHQDQVRQRAVGYLFHIVTYGIRTMPAYGSQIPVADRWAIVAYVRALQRSQNARLEDVPADVRESLR
jgi:mono/diheme cytochrome c family protein